MRLLFLIFLTLSALPSLGQKIKYSAPQKIGDRNLFTSIAGSTGEYIVAFRQNYKNAIFSLWSETYSRDMKRVSASQIFSESEGRVLNYEITDSTICFLYVRTDRQNKRVDVKMRVTDLLYRRIRDKQITTIDESASLPSMRTDYDSANDIYYLIYLQETESGIAVNELGFDTSGTRHLGRSASFELPKETSITQYVRFAGKTVAVLREPVPRKELRQTYRLHMLYGSGGNLSRESLFTDTLVSTDAKLARDMVKNDIVLAGLYSKPDTSYIKGYFVWRYSGGETRPVFRFNNFNDYALTQMAGRNSRVEGLYNLKMGDIVLRQDGGLVMAAEEHHVSEEVFSDIGFNGMSTTNVRYYFYYNNILLVNLNPDYSVQWASVMRKDQVSVNDNGIYSSYLLHTHPGKTYFVYNDLSRRTWTLSYYAVDKFGQPENNILIPSDNYDARIFPRDGRQTAFNELVMPAYNKKGYLLVKVNF